jgi:Domain of unknown function (DUF4189)
MTRMTTVHPQNTNGPSLSRHRALVLAACMLVAGAAQAQCRIGSGPDFGDGIPYCAEQPSEDYVVPSGPAWETRWGAIVVDPKASTGGIGLASDMKSRSAAEKSALKMCRRNGGGKTCRVELYYDNQCGVMAWGDDYYTTANAEDLEDATQMALGSCARKTAHCKVFYANCSYPVRIR